MSLQAIAEFVNRVGCIIALRLSRELEVWLKTAYFIKNRLREMLGGIELAKTRRTTPG